MTGARPRRHSIGFTIKLVVFGLIGATAVVFATGIEISMRALVAVIDEKYADLPGRMKRLEAVVFPASTAERYFAWRRAAPGDTARRRRAGE